MFIAAIVVFSVGLHEAVAHPTEPLHRAGAGLLVGGTALFRARFGSPGGRCSAWSRGPA